MTEGRGGGVEVNYPTGDGLTVDLGFGSELVRGQKGDFLMMASANSKSKLRWTAQGSRVT